jgi:hypothetical protein
MRVEHQLSTPRRLLSLLRRGSTSRAPNASSLIAVTASTLQVGVEVFPG